MPIIIVKETKNHYKVSVTNVHNLLTAKILADCGDTVTVIGISQDPSDSSFYIIETE